MGCRQGDTRVGVGGEVENSGRMNGSWWQRRKAALCQVPTKVLREYLLDRKTQEYRWDRRVAKGRSVSAASLLG